MLFSIAWRNLWRNKVRSLLILLSVAIGIWAGAFIAAIYNGMAKERLRIAIDKEVSHIQVHHPLFGDDIEAKFSFQEDSLRQLLSGQSFVKAFSLRSVTSGMLANASGSRGVQINGVDAAAENATRSLASFIKEGNYFDTAASNRILVSRKLAGKLNIQLNGKVVLTFLDTANNITSAAFRVTGLFETQNAPLDEANVFVLKKDLDHLLGTPGRAHEAAVLLLHDEDLDQAFAFLKAALPNMKIQRWQEISPETALVISSLDVYNLIFIGIILLALCFGIVNTMLMAVLERVREIGVLMALGMSKTRLFAMILLETVLLTFAGTPLGIFFAWLTVAALQRTGIDWSHIAGDTMKNFGYPTITYPLLPWHTVGQILQLVVVAAVLSALYPAWKAIRLRPVEAIRT